MWRVLRRFGLSVADAEDGTQEVFLVVNHRLADYEERGAARAWLFAICRQVARVHLRRAGRTRPVEDLGEELVSRDDPAAAMERAEAVAEVNEFLATLSEDQSMVFYLLEVEDMTAPEVAAALAVSVNTVYGRLRLAHERFDAFLARRAARAAREVRAWR